MAQSNTMPFLQHLGELRGHLIRSIIAIVIGATIAGINSDIFFDEIIFGPTKKDFITFRIFNQLGNFFGYGNIFKNNTDIPIQNLEIMGQFNLYFITSAIAGFILAFPYIIWEIWRFITPALTEAEKKISAIFILSTCFLFFIGICFGYFLVAPLAINFGSVFTVSNVIQNNYTINSYSSTLIQTVVAMGITFLFPVLTYFLTRLDLISPNFFKEYRKHAFVVILIVAAIITPSDLLSMFAAAIPLLLLYEFSIFISYLTKKFSN
ncbi:MAG: twin-arginine translocase subunit TatC [Solirubrobacteraceae bacterium]